MGKSWCCKKEADGKPGDRKKLDTAYGVMGGIFRFTEFIELAHKKKNRTQVFLYRQGYHSAIFTIKADFHFRYTKPVDFRAQTLHYLEDYDYARRRSRRLILLLKVLLREFKGFLISMGLAFSFSVGLLYSFYPAAELGGHKMTLTQAAYYTLLMIFFESPLNYVEDPRLSLIFFVLPILGLIIIAEGVVHLGNLLFQHKRYSKEWQSMIAETMEDHVVVCGLGNVGVRVVEHLRRFAEDVVAIESNESARFVAEVGGLDVPVLFGDVRDSAALVKASVRKAKAIICVTDNDLANLEAALTARELNPDIRVVIRMFDQNLAKKVEKSMGIQGAYSSSARSARLFAQAAISGDILDSFEFGGTVINAVQLTVEPNTILVGHDIDYLRGNYEVTILCHEKSDGVVDWNPAPSNPLGVGDRLLIMTDRAGLERLKPLSSKLALPRDTH